MPRLIPLALMVCLSELVSGQADDWSLGDKAYVVLQKQNLGETWCEAAPVQPVGYGVFYLYSPAC